MKVRTLALMVFTLNPVIVLQFFQILQLLFFIKTFFTLGTIVFPRLAMRLLALIVPVEQFFIRTWCKEIPQEDYSFMR